MKWFKKPPKKNLPDFWAEYAERFDEKTPESFGNATFTVLDTETTGFHYKRDRILSIGAVKIKQMQIEVSTSLELYLHQERFNPETVEIHGILKEDSHPRVDEMEAMHILLEYLGNSVIVAHHASFDVSMINKAMKRQGLPKLKNLILDTVDLHRKTIIKSNLIDQNKNYSLDELAYFFDIDVSDRHTAAGDAYITAIIFLRTIGKLQKSKEIELIDLI